DRHPRGAHDLPERSGALDVGARHPDDIRAGILAASDLVDRRRRIGCWRVGHRLHGDRRVPADRHVADHDLATRAPMDRAPGADCVHLGLRLPGVPDTVDTTLEPKLPPPNSAQWGSSTGLGGMIMARL